MPKIEELTISTRGVLPDSGKQNLESEKQSYAVGWLPSLFRTKNNKYCKIKE